jgi:hypothetical protein
MSNMGFRRIFAANPAENNLAGAVNILHIHRKECGECRPISTSDPIGPISAGLKRRWPTNWPLSATGKDG